MRFEIILFLGAALVMANIYTDGRLLKTAMGWKKYYQMAGVLFGAFVIYFTIRRNPKEADNMIRLTGDYLKYLPVDRSVLNPILDFTAKQNYAMDPHVNSADRFMSFSTDPTDLFTQNDGVQAYAEKRLMGSGSRGPTQGERVKRSVSETKKKFVASRQSWKCGHCQNQLSAWFEVDHKVRLEYGGSNHVDNLVALCRECHASKTAHEVMDRQI
jgi:5-methylcytosine-specific restriction endonuclease McrA